MVCIELDKEKTWFIARFELSVLHTSQKWLLCQIGLCISPSWRSGHTFPLVYLNNTSFFQMQEGFTGIDSIF